MITLNGVRSDSFNGLIVREVIERVLPPVNQKAFKTNGMDGLRDFGYTLEAKEITVQFGIHYPSLTEGKSMVREISGWLFNEDLVPLIMDYEPDIEYMVRVVDAGQLSGEHHYEEFEVTFNIPSGLGTSISPHESLLNVGSNNIQVLGTYKTYPIYTFNVNTNVSSLEVSNGESKVKVVDNFVIGDEVIIDCVVGKVTVNGSVVPITTLTSDFFPLKPGSNTLTVTGGQATVSHHSKWL